MTCLKRTSWLLLAVWAFTFQACGDSAPPSSGPTSTEILDRISSGQRRHDPVTFREVDLGEFFVIHRRGEGSTLFVRFHIYGVVPQQEQDSLTAALATHENRLRDVVIAIVQGTDVDHLTDPTLGWVKAELIPAVNKVLRTTAVRDVVFSEFSIEAG